MKYVRAVYLFDNYLVEVGMVTRIQLRFQSLSPAHKSGFRQPELVTMIWAGYICLSRLHRAGYIGLH